MSVKFANNAHSTLASGISTSATSITVASGQGARFPSLTGSEFFYATLIDTSNNLEIVKVTARSTDVLTATRAQESTSARAFSSGDRIELRVTAQGLADHIDLDNVVADNSITAAKLNISGNGTSGQAVLTDGDGSFSYGAAGGGLQSQQVFTSSGTYTKPSGITKIKVIVTGGGAGGGSGSGSNNPGGGGGAGGTAIEVIDVSSLSSTVAVTVGSGGSGGSANGGQTGISGGTSSFGSYCSATGGTGGDYAAASAQEDKGDGGVGSGGDINIHGGRGEEHGAHSAQDQSGGGHGGASIWGGGGRVANSWTGSNSSSGEAYGSGGGGGIHTDKAGSSGAGGIVVVEEYK